MLRAGFAGDPRCLGVSRAWFCPFGRVFPLQPHCGPLDSAQVVTTNPESRFTTARQPDSACSQVLIDGNRQEGTACSSDALAYIQTTVTGVLVDTGRNTGYLVNAIACQSLVRRRICGYGISHITERALTHRFTRLLEYSHHLVGVGLQSFDQYRKSLDLASSTTQAKPSRKFSPVIALHRRICH